MSKRKMAMLAGLGVFLASLLIVACGGPGSAGQPRPSTPTPTGSVVAFGTDAPLCNVESFKMTITTASLVPQSGGTAVSLITSAAPATLDFARLVDFTNILSTTSSIPDGTYTELEMALTSPQLITLNTATTPPSGVTVPVTLTTTSLTIPISPPLVITSGITSGLILDLNLEQSLEVNGSGAITGTVDPVFTMTPTTPAGTTVGEATSLYGVTGTPSTTSLPSGFTGSFPLALHDGTGQTVTLLTNSNTVFEGDGVTAFSNLAANTFVEVDAIVNTSGQIVAQLVDSEEAVSSASGKSAFLGKIVSVTRVVNGNVTAFNLVVDDEVPSQASGVPLGSNLNVTLTAGVHYFSNWQFLNLQAFSLSPQTLGIGEKVAVFGTLAAGSSLSAEQVFLRPRPVLGNFVALQAHAYDNVTGGFTMTPCGGLLGTQTITVLTYPTSKFSGVSGLTGLTTAPTLDAFGVLFYEQTSGAAVTGGSWTAPTWVLQARGVRQLPN